MTTVRVALHISALLFIALAPALAEAQGSTEKKQEVCIEQMNDRTAALVAGDWTELIRLADRYVKTCKGTFGAEDDSTPYENMAVANVNLGNYKAAIAAADLCTKTFYSNSGCHVWRLEALARLNRIPEARASYEKLDRLIGHLQESNERNVRDASRPLERELYESIRRKLEAQRQQAETLKERYFPQ